MLRASRLLSSACATRAVYMDVQATSPLDPRVLDAMLPYMTEKYGNAQGCGQARSNECRLRIS